MFEAWSEASGNNKDAKNHGNVVHLPILSVKADTLIIDLIPPPELHLLLGAVNTLFSRWFSFLTLLYTVMHFH